MGRDGDGGLTGTWGRGHTAGTMAEPIVESRIAWTGGTAENHTLRVEAIANARVAQESKSP